MHSRTDQSSAVANRDINPSDHLVAAYPDLACLLRNQAISAAFAGFEESALRWKRIYVFFGRLSLIAVLLAMISYDYQITLKHVYGAPAFLAGIAAAFAAAGLFSQTFLGLTHAKDRWLANRFGAERLRCFKFQLFTVLEEVSDAEGLAHRVQQRTNEGLAALEQELMGGRAAILEFSPFDVLAPARRKPAHTSRKLLDEAAMAYDVLRFSVECQHFEDQYRNHDRETKFPSLLSEFSFMFGAALACIGILTALLPAAWPMSRYLTAPALMEWVDFLTWMLFVLSAVVAIYERGSANQQNAERYVTFGREVRRIRTHAMSHMPDSFFEAVREMEHLMLREIQDFCRDVKHSNYIF
ncbi:MAG TPA: hypothetical protein VFI23_13980 [Rhizomicrobium sp.]|nr:hypothetical protein [Rhizomicrobium sp.]